MIERDEDEEEKLVYNAPRKSMTEPALSSLAGKNPPNPVLAVISGCCCPLPARY